MPWKINCDAIGKPFKRWVPFRMPRWPDEVLDCTVFLYQTVEEAESGSKTGGCGFLTGIPWDSNPEKRHVYAVTNYHVAKGGGASVIRLNTKDGKSKSIETEPTEWFHLLGRDLAIYRIDSSKHFGADSIFDYKFSNFLEIKLTEDIWSKYNIGIGDDVFSVGRFMDLSGIQKNQPFLRTGILSAGQIISVGQDTRMPWAGEPSYIIEMRSRSGFSGSPVYIYIDPWTPRMVDTEIDQTIDLNDLRFAGPWLLGVHWGQLPIVGPDAIDSGSASASMLAVVPCSALTRLLLEDQDVIQERREYEQHWADSARADPESVKSMK